jgi:hypothetical protein
MGRDQAELIVLRHSTSKRLRSSGKRKVESVAAFCRFQTQTGEPVLQETLLATAMTTPDRK